MSLLYVAQLKKENDYLKELCKDSYKLLLRKLREISHLKKSEDDLMTVILFLQRKAKGCFPGFDEYQQFQSLSEDCQKLILDC